MRKVKRHWPRHTKPDVHGADVGSYREVTAGDRTLLVPPRLSCTFLGRDGAPDVALEVVLADDGSARIVRLEVTAAPDGDAITDAKLRGVSVKLLADLALADAAWLSPGTPVRSAINDAVGFPSAGDALVMLAGVANSTSERVAVTDGRLRQAAQVYREALAAGSRSPVQAVAAALGTGHRNAGRIVGRARDAGYLPQTTQGKAQAE